MLGVAAGASHSAIRSAYRRKMRELHPDSQRGEDKGNEKDGNESDRIEMAAVATAWSILSQESSRSRYDRELNEGVQQRVRTNTRFEDLPQVQPMPFGPAKFPWRVVTAVIVFGIVVILVLAAFSKPSGPAKPDNLLQSGSCVNFDTTGAAFEVSCDVEHDAIVRQFVGVDATCPLGTEPHRDRQGMGLACTDPAK